MVLGGVPYYLSKMNKSESIAQNIDRLLFAEDGELRVTSGNIYSVDGRLIRQNATTLEGLPRGTYIVDGKKYMVK